MEQRANIDYPTQWVYKIIGLSEAAIIDAVSQCLNEEKAKTLSRSNSSRNGKFVSMELKHTVQSDEERQTLFHDLWSKEGVKMVL